MNKMNDYEAMLHINLCLAFGDRGWVIGDTDLDSKFISTKEEFDDQGFQDLSLHVPALSISAAMTKAYQKFYDGPFAEELKNHSGAFPLITLADTVGFWTTVHEAKHKEVGYHLNREIYRFGENFGETGWWGYEAKWLWDFEQNPTNKQIHQHLESLKPIYAGESIWLTATQQIWIMTTHGMWLKVDSDTLIRCPERFPDKVRQEIQVVRSIANASGEKSLL